MAKTPITHRHEGEKRASDIPTAQCLIDGEWGDGGGPVKETLSPVDGTVVTRVAFATPEQVDAAVAAARAAQLEWARVPMATRAQVFDDALNQLEAESEDVCRWISIEKGKTINEARDEVVNHVTLPLARATIEDARRFGGKTVPAWSEHHPGRRVQTIYQPIGVAALISPYVVESLERTTAEMEAAGHPAVARTHSFGAAGDGAAAYYDTADALGFLVEAVEPPSRMPPIDFTL